MGGQECNITGFIKVRKGQECVYPERRPCEDIVRKCPSLAMKQRGLRQKQTCQHLELSDFRSERERIDLLLTHLESGSLYGSL